MTTLGTSMSMTMMIVLMALLSWDVPPLLSASAASASAFLLPSISVPVQPPPGRKSVPVVVPPHTDNDDLTVIHLDMSAVGGGDIDSSTSTRPSVAVDARDRRSVLAHLASCLTSAIAVSTYEDYDCTHLKPNVGSLRRNSDYFLTTGGDVTGGSNIVGAATRGMGVSTTTTSSSLTDIVDMNEVTMRPSYNDVMKSHRINNVETWRNLRHSSSTSDTINRREVEQATAVIRECVSTLVVRCKPLAEDYAWEELRGVLNSRLFTVDMGRACHVLFYSLPPPPGDVVRGWTSARGREEESARTVIGFDWGSCAWRHCGALADAQEALAELRNSLGMLEPYECLFVLDIVERSLRDVLAVVPPQYGGTEEVGKKWRRPWRAQREEGSLDLPPYVPYRSREDLGLEGAYGYVSSEGGIDGDGVESSRGGGMAGGDNGLDYMSVLARFRNDDL